MAFVQYENWVAGYIQALARTEKCNKWFGVWTTYVYSVVKKQNQLIQVLCSTATGRVKGIANLLAIATTDRVGT